MEVQITCDGAENTAKGISKRVITGLFTLLKLNSKQIPTNVNIKH